VQNERWIFAKCWRISEASEPILQGSITNIANSLGSSNEGGPVVDANRRDFVKMNLRVYEDDDSIADAVLVCSRRGEKKS
jgi:hypothetical protein